jgi:AraC-like DNA-binding protein
MRAFYPRLDDMRDAITGVRDSTAAPEPFFAQPIIDDPRLGPALRALHRSLERPGHALEQETRSINAAALLAMRHARPASSRTKPRGNAEAVRRAAEYIQAHHGTNVSLTALAALTELSPFHLVHLFNAAFGMPPHAYLTNVRLGKARALLAAGVPAARTAVEVGFTDQSHLLRRFRHAYGITPGQFVTATRTSNTR